MKQYGFIADEIAPEDYVFRGYKKIGGKVLRSDGQWDHLLPEYEPQSRENLDTQNCTVYGTVNCLETLLAHHHMQDLGSIFNFSERYVGVMAGTSPGGNTPHKVIEIIRKESGLIDEHFLPFSEDIKTWDQYYSPDPMSRSLIIKGQLLLKHYKIGHEWVFTGGTVEEKKIALMDALQYSPIGVSVHAWKKRTGKYWKNPGEQDNHWCTLYGYVEGKYWKVFDHYDDRFKELEIDYDFGFAKRYSISPKPKKESWWRTVLAMYNPINLCKQYGM